MTTGWSLAVSVSPVSVSLSLATATMSPAFASATLTCSLPCGRKSPEKRSGTLLPEFQYVPSDWKWPARTRR